MINITLSAEEAQRFIESYQQELSQLEVKAKEYNDKVAQVKAKIKDLQVQIKASLASATAEEKKGAKNKSKKEKEVINTTKGKRKKDNIDWEGFIVSTMQESNKLFGSGELVTLAKDKLKIGAGVLDEPNNALTRALVSLVDKSQRLKKIKVQGRKGYMYGLSEFFEENGDVKPEYAI